MLFAALVLMLLFAIACWLACFATLPRFKRSYPDQHMAADGIGLGLSIVKLLVDKHHGEVGARNNPNGGSTFYVSLPLPPQQPQR